ncbi:hypothetical protein H4R20_002939 [Coemansia guatemalensis]|uniref:Dbl homology domain-containing protein n=1 Tax=Coemansia guatemalensis TaxID=2761395 RepID=A0A9W8HUM1_9FUNG|nr:hypothetical protein H4R20_002939 [Coemansia guatemalensis]
MMTEDPGTGADSVGDNIALANHLSASQQMLAQRARIAGEILCTERTYVEGLGLIEKLYIAPLLASAQQQSPILSRKDVRRLFANFPDIITLSRELLCQLDARLGPNADPPWDPNTGRIGDIFMRIAPFLKMYSLYLRNFRSALSDISRWLGENHEFARFIQQASANPECRGLSLQSYLLLPVQRIPRYKLLLEDLLKHTPRTHVDHHSIGDALRTIEEVAEFVNENIEEHEMTLSIIEIQRTLGIRESLLVPGRRLVKMGTLTKICRKSHQQRSFYLFSDILLYSSGPAPLIDDQSGHRRVPLEDCKVMDVPDTGEWLNQFTIISREKSFIVYTETAAEKLNWMAALSAAILEQRKARESLQMDRSLKRRIARTRRSTMMHFPRVAENFDAPVWDPDESADRCYICFRDFTLFMRRHHCRACGKIVCNACSRKNIVFVGQTSTEAKEGRGCDQCIARLFGREALESPPGTIHRFLSRSRHSLDPGSLIQSLSALKVGTGSIRHLPTVSRPLAPWGAGSIRRCSIGDHELSSSRGAAPHPESDLSDGTPVPSIAQIMYGHVDHGQVQESQDRCYTHAADIFRQSPPPQICSGAMSDMIAGAPSAQTAERSPRPPTPLPTGSSSSKRGSLATDPASMPLFNTLQSTKPARASVHKVAKHLSTGSALEWDSQPVSARSTLLYETPSPTALRTGASSPMSTISHHRISLVSSCSTIGPESSLRIGQVRVQRPIAFATCSSGDSGAARGPGNLPVTSSTSHCSLVALYGNSSASASSSLPSLISPAAPPKVTLVQAEAVAGRQRRAANATLCSLCHGNFAMQHEQHQCSSCLSLVCSRCIKHRPIGDGQAEAAPKFTRILSMYVPDGHQHVPGALVCTSCAARSGHTDAARSHGGQQHSSAYACQ